MRHLDKERTAPDILDCIANLSSDEVFTPPRLANQMLNLLPKDVWSDPDLKWLDPGTKTGVFLREIARRLMDGLSGVIPDEDARREHIYKTMLYGLPITELTSMLARRSVYYSKNADHEHYAVVRMGSPEGNIPLVETKHTFKGGSCSQCGAPESLERGETRENYAYPFIHPDQLPKGFKDMKFDVIVGNPPYQISDGGNGASASPIYHKFVEAALDMDPRHVVMIIPSRWFAGGKGLDKFRSRMLADRRVRALVDYPKLYDCFPGVKIRGGVSYFHWSREHEGPCTVQTMWEGSPVGSPMPRYLDAFDVLVRRNEAVSILEKVRAYRHTGSPESTLGNRVSSRKPFGFPTNFHGVQDSDALSNPVKLYGSQRVSWVERDEITKNLPWVDEWKVLMTRVQGTSAAVETMFLGKPIVSGPGEACSETYLVAGRMSTEDEAVRYAAYLKTRFVRFLVSLRKSTQDAARDVYSFVPNLPMDSLWTDEMLFERYGLTEDEVLFIKSQIKEMP